MKEKLSTRLCHYCKKRKILGRKEWRNVCQYCVHCLSGPGAEKYQWQVEGIPCCSECNDDKTKAAVVTLSCRELCEACAKVEKPFRFLDLPPELRNVVYEITLHVAPRAHNRQLFLVLPDTREEADEEAMIGDKLTTKIISCKRQSLANPHDAQSLLCKHTLMAVSKQVNTEFYDQFEGTIFNEQAQSDKNMLLFRVHNWNFSALLKYLKSLKKTRLDALINGKSTLHISLSITHARNLQPGTRHLQPLHPSFYEYIDFCASNGVKRLHTSYALESFVMPFLLIPTELHEWRNHGIEGEYDQNPPPCDIDFALEILDYVDHWVDFLVANGRFSKEELTGRSENEYALADVDLRSCRKARMLQFPHDWELDVFPREGRRFGGKYGREEFTVPRCEDLRCGCRRRLMSWKGFAEYYSYLPGGQR